VGRYGQGTGPAAVAARAAAQEAAARAASLAGVERKARAAAGVESKRVSRGGLRVRNAHTGIVALSFAATAAAEAETEAEAARKSRKPRSRFVGVRWHPTARTWAAYLTPAQPGIRAYPPPPRPLASSLSTARAHTSSLGCVGAWAGMSTRVDIKRLSARWWVDAVAESGVARPHRIDRAALRRTT
jgi:hypothetical protein